MDQVATIQSLISIAAEIRRHINQSNANLASLQVLMQRVEDILVVIVPINTLGPEVCRFLQRLQEKLTEAQRLVQSVDAGQYLLNAANADRLRVTIDESNVDLDRVITLLHLAVTIASVTSPDRRNKANLFNLGFCTNAIDMKSAGLTHHDFSNQVMQQALHGVLLYVRRFRIYCRLLGLPDPTLPDLPDVLTQNSAMIVTNLVSDLKSFLEGEVVPAFHEQVPYIQLGMEVFLFECVPTRRDTVCRLMLAVNFSQDSVETILSYRGNELTATITRVILNGTPPPATNNHNVESPQPIGCCVM